MANVTYTVKKGDTLSYRILAASRGSYDLSVLFRDLGQDHVEAEILVDGQAVGTQALSSQDSDTASLILRGIELTKGAQFLPCPSKAPPPSKS